MARHDRTVRLETLKRALTQSRRGVALKTLAERHSWALRTLYHDVEALELAGYPVISEEGRFRIEGSVPAPPSSPTADERLALFLAREQAHAWKHTSLGKALDRLWHRLSTLDGQAALMPLEAVAWIDTRTSTSIDYGHYRKIVATLEKGVRDGHPVQAKYRSVSAGTVTTRVIEPGQLHWDPSLETLYLIGWCRLRRDVRVFAVHRFLAASVVDTERIARRPETRSTTALKSAFRVWRSSVLEQIRVWFAPEVAEEIKERRWLPDQRIASAGDGSVVVSGVVAGLSEVERWVLSYGSRARALEPAGLVERINDHLTKMRSGPPGTHENALPSVGKAIG